MGGLLTLAASPGCGRREGVVAYISVDDVLARPILESFERATGARVDVVFDVEATKTTGLYRRLLVERQVPRADVVWFGEPSRILALAREGILAPLDPAVGSDLPGRFRPSPGLWAGIGSRARVLVYNTRRLKPEEGPRSIFDLTSPRFRGEVGISDPLFGTMATHAAALRAHLGASAMESYFRALIENGARVLAGNSVVRDRVASGELLCGVVDTDDANVALERGLPVAVVFPDQEPAGGRSTALGCFIFPTGAARVRGGPHPELAGRLLEHLLRSTTEAELARGEGAFLPLRPGVPGPARLVFPSSLVRLEVGWEELLAGLDESQAFLRSVLVR